MSAMNASFVLGAGLNDSPGHSLLWVGHIVLRFDAGLVSKRRNYLEAGGLPEHKLGFNDGCPNHRYPCMGERIGGVLNGVEECGIICFPVVKQNIEHNGSR